MADPAPSDDPEQSRPAFTASPTAESARSESLNESPLENLKAAIRSYFSAPPVPTVSGATGSEATMPVADAAPPDAPGRSRPTFTASPTAESARSENLNEPSLENLKAAIRSYSSAPPVPTAGTASKSATNNRQQLSPEEERPVEESKKVRKKKTRSKKSPQGNVIETGTETSPGGATGLPPQQRTEKAADNKGPASEFPADKKEAKIIEVGKKERENKNSNVTVTRGEGRSHDTKQEATDSGTSPASGPARATSSEQGQPTDEKPATKLDVRSMYPGRGAWEAKDSDQPEDQPSQDSQIDVKKSDTTDAPAEPQAKPETWGEARDPSGKEQEASKQKSGGNENDMEIETISSLNTPRDSVN